MLISLIVCPGQASAFYEWQGEKVNLEARGLILGYASAYENPDEQLIYPDSRATGTGGVARLIVDGDISKRWHFDFNVYQTYIPEALLSAQNISGSTSGSSFGVERSAILEKSFSDSDYAHLAVDRLAIRWSGQDLDLTIGRQAINLATTFYFTPNDFFAPFSAQTFYRVYKQGVDAVRAEISLGELSQLSLISVLGYKADISSSTGWSNKPDSSRTSYLVHWSKAFGYVEAILTAGQLVDKNIVGGALQGELFDWLGVRLEGHYADSRHRAIDDYQQFSFGLEHRWESSLELRMEFFYNGLGESVLSQYKNVQISNTNQYLGRRYSALGGSYEITPLLTGEAVVLSNLNDHSHLLSFNAVYSLSNESEVVFNLVSTVGDTPENGVIKSEFGTYPASINMEYRLYF